MSKNICYLAILLFAVLTPGLCYDAKTNDRQQPFATFEINKTDAAKLLNRPGLLLADKIYRIGDMIIIKWKIFRKNSDDQGIFFEVKTEYEAINVPIYGKRTYARPTIPEKYSSYGEQNPEIDNNGAEEDDPYFNLRNAVDHAIGSGYLDELRSIAGELMSETWWNIENNELIHPVETMLLRVLKALEDGDESVYDIFCHVIHFDVKKTRIQSIELELLTFAQYLKRQNEPRLIRNAVQFLQAELKNRISENKKNQIRERIQYLENILQEK